MGLFKRRKNKLATTVRYPRPSDTSPLDDTDRQFRRRKRGGHKKLIIFVCLFVLAGIGGLIYLWLASPAGIAPSDVGQDIKNRAKDKEIPDTIRMLAAGDFVPETTVNNAAQQADGTYDYLPIYEGLSDLFKKTEIRYCSSPMLTGGSQYGISDRVPYNGPTEFVDGMYKLGCNLVNTSSKYSLDKDQATINATIKAWQSHNGMLGIAGLNVSRDERNNIHYFTIYGVKFAYMSFTTATDKPLSNDYAVAGLGDKEWVTKQFLEAKYYGAKVIIVSMSWGEENGTAVTQAQKDDAQFLTSQGANLILGHGPQAVQPVQELTGPDGTKAVVWYSMGSFLRPGAPENARYGVLGAIDFDVARRRVKALGFLPIYQQTDPTDMRVQLLDNSILPEETVNAQKQRLVTTLNSAGQSVRLRTTADYQ